MARLAITCEQAVVFLKENRFRVMDTLKEFKFSKNKIKIKVKVSILRPWMTLHMLKFEDGVLHLRADSKNVLKIIMDIFVDFEKRIKKILDKENLDDYIHVFDDLNFQIEVNKFIVDGVLKIKGISVTDIQLIRKKLQIDFDILKVENGN